MAAPVRYFSAFICQTRFHGNSLKVPHRLLSLYSKNGATLFRQNVGSRTRSFSSFGGSANKMWIFRSKYNLLLTAGVAVPVLYLADLYRRASVVFADAGGPFQFKPIRRVRSDTDSTGLKLTLFQYQSCPFCCKTRAYLDARGFSYDVVEVNSVWRKELKWSKYRKVPILVVQGIGPDGYIQINDSSIVISVLETLLENPGKSLDKILEYFPSLESKDEKGKQVTENLNKYYIMKGREVTPAMEEAEVKERKWRQWTDEVLIHTLAPNMYRTLGESKEAFEHFSKVGEWEKVFSTAERKFVIYFGTVSMYLLAKILKRRYKLNANVRISLYVAAIEWMQSLDPRSKFQGGETPNLADLAVYGVMSSFEDITAFKDCLHNSNIDSWFFDVKDYVDDHKGRVLSE